MLRKEENIEQKLQGQCSSSTCMFGTASRSLVTESGTSGAAEPACKTPGGAGFCNEWTPSTLYLANIQSQPREEG